MRNKVKSAWICGGKKTMSLTLAVVVGLLFTIRLYADEAHHGQEQSGKSGSQTIQGEVLDMVCYMGHEGKGAKHKSCAQKCIDGGAPMGLLTKEGRVYLLLEDHNAPKPYMQIKKWAAEQVTVKGKLIGRGGVQAVVVFSSEKN